MSNSEELAYDLHMHLMRKVDGKIVDSSPQWLQNCRKGADFRPDRRSPPAENKVRAKKNESKTPNNNRFDVLSAE